MSGTGGHGGMVDLRTHLLGSGRGHAGQFGSPYGFGLHEHSVFPQLLHEEEVGQLHGFGFVHRLHVPSALNPSFVG
jgi:hypothetical protein